MSRLRNFALGAAAALPLAMAQPGSAEAGDAGKIIAGFALGAITAAILSDLHDDDDHYYAPYGARRPVQYYEPRPYVYYAPRSPYYYVPQQHYRSDRGKPSRYLQSHPSAFRSQYGFSPDSAQGKAFIKSFR
jgi:hypothetical protein